MACARLTVGEEGQALPYTTAPSLAVRSKLADVAMAHRLKPMPHAGRGKPLPYRAVWIGAEMEISWGKADWKNALLTALGTTLCYWLTLALGLKTGYWAAITCIVVAQSEAGATLLASRDRLIGTAIGAVIGWGTVLIWHDHVVVYGMAVFLTIAICNMFDLRAAGRLAGVAVAIVMLVHRDGPAWQAAGGRFLEVAIGVVVALALTMAFYPRAFFGPALKMGLRS